MGGLVVCGAKIIEEEYAGTTYKVSIKHILKSCYRVLYSITHIAAYSAECNPKKHFNIMILVYGWMVVCIVCEM